ncbi:hypothetical protein [Moorella sp. Hama-1]|uniref:hypothetical protein n=1 Tax=Moorella sp. Hama-1 TaxID=2138101 RepID=UPI000D643C7E|nr:hypothetical protein [Moorella sp. Hama-1]
MAHSTASARATSRALVMACSWLRVMALAAIWPAAWRTMLALRIDKKAPPKSSSQKRPPASQR